MADPSFRRTRHARLRGLFFMAVPVGLVGGCTPEVSRADGGIRVLDDRGREVVLAAPAQRVVSVIPSITETVVELAGPTVLVARTRYDQDARLAHLPDLGGGLGPNLEGLAGLRPDLVVTWAADANEALDRVGRSVGFAVYGARTGTLEGFFETLGRMGKLLDRAEAALVLERRLRGQLDAVEASVSGLARPSVLYVVWHDPPQAAGPGSYLDALITLAGGTNVFADAGGPWPQVSLEEIVRRDPRVVVVGGADGGQGPPPWLAGPGWSELTAAREGRVYVVDSDLFNRPGPHAAEAAERLARLLHPERPR